MSPLPPDANDPADADEFSDDEVTSEYWREGPVDLYRRDGLYIEAEINAKGALKIRAQDLNPPFGWEEYEYTLLIPAEALPLIRTALGGTDEDSLLRLLATHAEQIMPGLKTWLDSVGAHYEFWSRIEPGHG